MELKKWKKQQFERANQIIGGSMSNRISESNQVNAPLTFGGLVYPNVIGSLSLDGDFYEGEGEFNRNSL